MHAEILYKATETAVYKIGLASGVDATYSRASFEDGDEGDYLFTLQWKGTRYDSAQISGFSRWGEEPRDGLMQLKVDILTLPRLAEAEQTVMLDLRSIETGGQGHCPPFLGYHEGFPDENLFTVNKSARVFMATDLVEPFFHPEEHPCTCVPPPPSSCSQ